MTNIKLSDLAWFLRSWKKGEKLSWLQRQNIVQFLSRCSYRKNSLAWSLQLHSNINLVLKFLSRKIVNLKKRKKKLKSNLIITDDEKICSHDCSARTFRKFFANVTWETAFFRSQKKNLSSHIVRSRRKTKKEENWQRFVGRQLLKLKKGNCWKLWRFIYDKTKRKMLFAHKTLSQTHTMKEALSMLQKIKNSIHEYSPKKQKKRRQSINFLMIDETKKTNDEGNKKWLCFEKADLARVLFPSISALILRYA